MQEVLNERKLHFEKVHTDESSANMMTKTLPKEKLETYQRLADMYISSSARSDEIFLFGLEGRLLGVGSSPKLPWRPNPTPLYSRIHVQHRLELRKESRVQPRLEKRMRKGVVV